MPQQQPIAVTEPENLAVSRNAPPAANAAAVASFVEVQPLDALPHKLFHSMLQLGFQNWFKQVLLLAFRVRLVLLRDDLAPDFAVQAGGLLVRDAVGVLRLLVLPDAVLHDVAHEGLELGRGCLPLGGVDWHRRAHRRGAVLSRQRALHRRRRGVRVLHRRVRHRVLQAVARRGSSASGVAAQPWLGGAKGRVSRRRGERRPL
mmetsp:Transcript_38045/g.97340  ORF Transcript_38045/g.97340 Transcript_38045/m.97340 type:complete len:203 (-) Transcript_38045:349-957(-)